MKEILSISSVNVSIKTVLGDIEQILLESDGALVTWEIYGSIVVMDISLQSFQSPVEDISPRYCPASTTR